MGGAAIAGMGGAAITGMGGAAITGILGGGGKGAVATGGGTGSGFRVPAPCIGGSTEGSDSGVDGREMTIVYSLGPGGSVGSAARPEPE